MEPIIEWEDREIEETGVRLQVSIMSEEIKSEAGKKLAQKIYRAMNDYWVALSVQQGSSSTDG